MKPTVVFGKERGRVAVDDLTSYRECDNVYYDIPIVPHTPLHVGLEVRLYSIPDADGEPDGTPACYAPSETGIEGRIVAVRTMERDTTELVLKNNNKDVFTEYAYLTIRHEEGVTVRLTLWPRILRAILRPALHTTRHVRLEKDAVVLHAPRRTLRYAAPHHEPRGGAAETPQEAGECGVEGRGSSG